jgi:hypothetical protein
VDVSGASGAALDVDVDATAPVTVAGSRLHSSGVGLRANGGVIALQNDGGIATEVRDNANEGILLSGVTVLDATFAGVLVTGNDGTGIVVDIVPATSTLEWASCDVHSNGTATPRKYGPSGQERNAGGVLVRQPSLAGGFSLTGNRIYANGADQLAFESTAAWTISTGSCTSSNAFGCVPTGSAAVSVIPGGSVDAQQTAWDTIPPPVSGNVITSSFCATPPALVCPP